MTVEHGSSLDSTETAIDSMETAPAGEDAGPPARQGSARVSGLAAIRRWTRRCLARWRSIVATVLVVAAVGVPAGLFFILYRPDQRIDDATAHRAIQAASDGAVAVLTYSYDNLDRDFAAAKTHLTGDFLAYYSTFTAQIVAPTAQQGQLTTTAKVIQAAVSDLHPDSAVVLVFVDQTTASKQKPQPVKADNSVLVTLTKVNGAWLIAKFDPVG
jgi:Mce-associated membrane protein